MSADYAEGNDLVRRLERVTELVRAAYTEMHAGAATGDYDDEAFQEIVQQLRDHIMRKDTGHRTMFLDFRVGGIEVTLIATVPEGN